MPPDATTHRQRRRPPPTSGNLPANKKKEIRQLGVAAIHPNGQEERDPATPRPLEVHHRSRLPLSLSLPPEIQLQPPRLPSPAPDPASPMLQPSRLPSPAPDLSPFLSLSPKKNPNQSLYLQKVLANNKKIIPPNHHKQILPINPLNLYQISQPNRQQQTEPNQPSNKQPRKFFMAVEGGRRRS
jgi:hypothetical protein